MATRKEIRESYLDDIQILRNRQMGVPTIAEALGLHRKQVERWKEILKEQGRWREVIVKEYEPRRHARRNQAGEWTK